jgi:hypothetical protein
MKKAVLVLSSLALLGVAGFYWVYQTPSDVQETELEPVAATSTKAEETSELGPELSTSTEDDMSEFDALAVMGEEEKQIELLKVKDELDVLMARYDRNMSDESKRTEIKKEMQILMARYDKLVLQQAIKDIKKSKG